MVRQPRRRDSRVVAGAIAEAPNRLRHRHRLFSEAASNLKCNTVSYKVLRSLTGSSEEARRPVCPFSITVHRKTPKS